MNFSNYRPISLLSNIEKILEKLSDNNIIYPLQFSFRHEYFTFHALISLTEDIRKNLDKRNIGWGISVDAVERDIIVS